MSPPSSTAPSPPPSTSPAQSLVDRLGPDRLVLVVALVAFHGLVRIAERYLPEYLRALGYGPIVVGLLGSLALAVAVGVRFVETGETSDRALFATLLGALGLLAWAGAPTLDSLLGTPLTAIGWLVVGVVLLGLWRGWGPGIGTTGVLRAGRSALVGSSATSREPLPVESPPDESDGEQGNSSGTGTHDPDTRTRIVAGALGLAGGAVLATAAFSGAETTLAGFALLVAAGSTVGLVAAVALGVVGSAARPTDSSSPGEDAGGNEATSAHSSHSSHSSHPSHPSHPSSLPSLEDVREAFDSLPSETRWTAIGDAFVRLTTAMTVPFVVLVVVEYHAVALTVGSVSLPPAAVFGPLVLAEAVGAAAGALAAPTLEARVDRRWLLAAGLVVPAVFPLALVAAPSSVAVLAVLFALVGCRTALEPARPTGTVPGRTRGRWRRDAPLPETLRTAIRVALVPAPLLGGVLYAIGPVAAFSLATTIGLLGVRELLRPLR